MSIYILYTQVWDSGCRGIEVQGFRGTAMKNVLLILTVLHNFNAVIFNGGGRPSFSPNSNYRFRRIFFDDRFLALYGALDTNVRTSHSIIMAFSGTLLSHWKRPAKYHNDLVIYSIQFWHFFHGTGRFHIRQCQDLSVRLSVRCENVSHFQNSQFEPVLSWIPYHPLFYFWAPSHPLRITATFSLKRVQ